jgi:hypothetical protein
MAIGDSRSGIPQEEVMARMNAQLARLREGRSTEHTAQKTP